ncbi:hypothetical protein PsorP6_009458 [Peronosclerospora sorghi]|uniref:Uncharacterized protein n=1 Tax=Peronosclerospora sorghi TaxID=230839 RepID=A0ACC0VZQ0_9STRA|nr:hypothetical protein PsorP6_009458 [Peronosclerospora sorghi]
MHVLASNATADAKQTLLHLPANDDESSAATQKDQHPKRSLLGGLEKVSQLRSRLKEYFRPSEKVLKILEQIKEGRDKVSKPYSQFRADHRSRKQDSKKLATILAKGDKNFELTLKTLGRNMGVFLNAKHRDQQLETFVKHFNGDDSVALLLHHAQNSNDRLFKLQNLQMESWTKKNVNAFDVLKLTKAKEKNVNAVDAPKLPEKDVAFLEDLDVIAFDVLKSTKAKEKNVNANDVPKLPEKDVAFLEDLDVNAVDATKLPEKDVAFLNDLDSRKLDVLKDYFRKGPSKASLVDTGLEDPTWEDELAAAMLEWYGDDQIARIVKEYSSLQTINGYAVLFNNYSNKLKKNLRSDS